MLLALALLAAAPAVAQTPTDNDRPARIAAVATAAGFNGEILVGQGATIVAEQAFGTVAGTDAVAHRTGQRWPWASVTKQVVATMVMQQVAAGAMTLDAPIGGPVADGLVRVAGMPLAVPTLRQLLQHRAGLPNPADSAVGADGIEAFYSDPRPALAWCSEARGAPGGNWVYNNCDYILAGRLLEIDGGARFDRLFAARIARPAGLRATAPVAAGSDPARIVSATAADVRLIARFGASASLAGSARDMLAFDRALLDGRLLAAPSRAEMWRGDPQLGYMALGQWSFSAAIAGCAAPVAIVERRGQIGRYQVRNFILPESQTMIIIFTDRGDFAFSEIWQGSGFSHDLIAAAACPAVTAP